MSYFFMKKKLIKTISAFRGSTFFKFASFEIFQKTNHINWQQSLATFAVLFFTFSPPALSQSLPISIDSQFDDWTAEAVEFTDAQNDGDNIDFLRFEVANDEKHLFFQLEVAEEINLTEGHRITLFLDTDLDANTGNFANGIGVDLELRLGEREVFYQLPSGQGSMSLNKLGYRHQPTVTSSIFELAIPLDALSNAGFPLFNADGVRIFWIDETGPSGDKMPESNEPFTYFFDNSPTPPIELTNLEKEGQNLVRMVSWNTLNTGLDDIAREPFFAKVLAILNPDIITFNECWDISAPQVATFMNGAVPLENFASWNAVKLDQGNVTVSRFPILQNWLIFPGHRLTASLIDIPEVLSSTDLLVINGHLRCCGADFLRQQEADAFVQFILDAKTPGGVIDLPEGTPFLLSGDLNLVGQRQQLTTLLTGEVVNTNLFGQGGNLDWDGSGLLDVISRHSDERMAYTWRSSSSSFPPSRIDYQIISNSVLEVQKTFTLEPEAMSQQRLDQYGLAPFDVRNASDHLPKTMDLRLPLPLAAEEVSFAAKLRAFPNPCDGQTSISFELASPENIGFELQSTAGLVLKTGEKTFAAGENQFVLDMAGLPAGIYFFNIFRLAANGEAGTGTDVLKILKR